MAGLSYCRPTYRSMLIYSQQLYRSRLQSKSPTNAAADLYLVSTMWLTDKSYLKISMLEPAASYTDI